MRFDSRRIPLTLTFYLCKSFLVAWAGNTLRNGGVIHNGRDIDFLYSFYPDQCGPSLINLEFCSRRNGIYICSMSSLHFTSGWTMVAVKDPVNLLGFGQPMNLSGRFDPMYASAAAANWSTSG